MKLWDLIAHWRAKTAISGTEYVSVSTGKKLPHSVYYKMILSVEMKHSLGKHLQFNLNVFSKMVDISNHLCLRIGVKPQLSLVQ